MKETENYHLKQIEDGDKPSEYPSVQSENMRVIDEQMHELATEVTPIARGGTGATDATDALESLGAVGTRSTQGPAYGPLASVTAKGHAEQDGTPTPSDPKEIVVVRGRNLLDPSEFVNSVTTNSIVYTNNGDGSISFRGTATENVTRAISWASVSPKLAALIAQGGTFTFSSDKARYNLTTFNFAMSYSESGATKFLTLGRTATIQPGATLLNVGLYAAKGVTIDATDNFHLMLERGSTAHPYVPYGHVGLDVTANGTTTTTPIPLPSRGWVGSLPDGTHDALSIDGAGKVTWELGVYGRTLDGTDMSGLAAMGNYASSGGGFYQLSLEGITGATLESYTNLTARNSMSNRLTNVNGLGISVDNHGTVGYGQSNLNLRFRPVETDEAQTMEALQTWLTSNPLSLYLPMQVKPTESMGYVDLPDIPKGAVVSMPELEGLGVESWTSDAIARYVRAWAARP